jgi:hypothetical protein
MAKKRLTEKQKREEDRKNSLIAGLAALEIEFAEEAGDDDALMNLDQLRQTDISPPPQPEKNQYNPDGIVDIITFAEHPYFCDQTLHPWQKLVLKLFYMGSPGNQCVELLDKKPKTGCNGCVWEYAKAKEEEYAKKYTQTGIVPISMLPVENSPCLRCKRMDKDVVNTRFDSLVSSAPTAKDKKRIEELRDEELINRFENEMDMLNDQNPALDQEILDQVKSKLKNKFSELVLVLGRRSGKSFLVSIAALYEAYKLIKMGHPQKNYAMLAFDEISITNVAKNEKQADKAIFGKITAIANASPFFMPHIGNEVDNNLYLLTPADVEENKRRRKFNLPVLHGTVVVVSGNSSAGGLVGLTNWCVILDELSAMAGLVDPDSGVDVKLYEELDPSMATFGDDGKMMSLSNPRGPFGKLWELYTTRRTDPKTLILQVPTWKMNPTVPQDYLVGKKNRNPISYSMQYDAKFAEASQNPFLNPDLVDMAFWSKPQHRIEHGDRGFKYFCHLDPATSSDYYALTVCHLVNHEDPKMQPAIFIDHIHYWKPEGKNKPVQSEEVEKYIIDLHSRFRFAQVSFDQWNSAGSIHNLTKAGINAVCKPFNKKYSDMIYGTLYELFAEQRIFFYSIPTVYNDPVSGEIVYLQEVDLAKEQFKMLQKKWKGKKFKIEALHGYNDDIPDCIAASAYECLNSKIKHSLPNTRTVREQY